MYVFDATITQSGSEKSVLVVFSGQLEGSEIVYSELVEKHFRNQRIRPEEIFFIFPAYLEDPIYEMFSQGQRCFDAISRFGKKTPVSLLSFNRDADFKAISLVGTSDFLGCLGSVRDLIVQAGLMNLAENRRDQVILRAPSGTVFIKPSSKEFDEFIKASELAIGYAETQFVAFCLLSRTPNNRKIKRILIDTNSIAPYVESLLYYWVMFDESKCKPAIYESFGSYGGLDSSRPDTIDDVWVIISASRSNSMGKKIANDWFLENDQVITILTFSDTLQENKGDEALINVSNLSHSANRDLSQNSLMKVRVLGENFTAEVEKPNPVLIRARHKTPVIGTWIYPNRESGLFRCNRKASADHPLASIYVDCDDFFRKDQKYKEWLDRIVTWYVPPNVRWLVYRGVDAASVQIASDIELRLNSVGITGFEKIDINSAETQIEGTECVVVAMPVTGTGQTLLKLNRNLRISGHTGNRIFISPFVVAPSRATFSKARDSLLYGPYGLKYSFHSLLEIFIGSQDEETCWQRELKVVEHLDSEFWKARAEVLRNYEDGIGGEIGVVLPEGQGPLDFTQDFAFWPGEYHPDTINPEAVYVTFASILQSLREHKATGPDGDSLYSHVYQHSVIAPDNFTRFNDSLLQSVLWRAATGREMDYRASRELSEEFFGILSRLIDENVNGESNSAVDLLLGVAIGTIGLEAEVLSNLARRADNAYRRGDRNTLLLVEYIIKKYVPELTVSEDEAIPI